MKIVLETISFLGLPIEVPHTGCLKEQKCLFPEFQRLGIRNSSFGYAPSETCRGEPFLASPLPSEEGQQSLACSCPALLSTSILARPFPLSLSLCPFLEKLRLYWIKGPLLLQYDLILANYISNNPISKGQILKYWGLGVRHILLGDTVQPLRETISSH